MKYFYLLLIVFLFSLVVSAQEFNINLNSPSNNLLNATSRTIIFNCSTTSSNIDNITLYTNISGTFQTQTGDLVSGGYAQFTKNNIINGYYLWNCLVTNTSNYKEFASSNYTFGVWITVFEGVISNQTWIEDGSNLNAFNLSIYFKNATTYSVSGNSNVIIQIMNNGFVNFTQAANWHGSETVIFISNGVSSNPILLNVTGVNDAPIFEENISIQTITKNTNKTLDLGDYFSDVDNTLNYTYSSLQYITVYINGENVIFSPQLNWIGTEYIVFTAHDGQYNISSNNITLNVINSSASNHAPSIPSFYPLSIPDVIVGVPQVFNITFSDIDNDPLTVTWYLNNQVVSTNSSYTFLVQTIGNYNLTVFVSDGYTTSSITWPLTVSGSSVDNQTQDNMTSLCGNNQTDSGETCLSCPYDVKCGDDEVCVSHQCVKIEKTSFGSILIYIVSAVGFLLFSFALIGFLEKRRKIKIDKDVMNKAKQSMEDNTIESYIKKNLNYKIPEAVIKEKLLGVGWSTDDINKAFDKVKNENKPGTN
ncbi:MAG: Ig-like domain-containing protein [archaeon]